MINVWHVTPNNDLKTHREYGDHCHCKPRVEVQRNGAKIVVHNAYDGREFFEGDVKPFDIYTREREAE